ncbi:MAG: SufD family Fe-S cluster assembly protein [Bacilli bacterium]|nr:SufD family Fe-S cluster assembly protein [Bacilli bacterium]MDD4282933.1 SufD family Fe-S cluster assembly protein [Bacilli bacterium]MDD4718667.1 SufD family Fe-S cluster assembly protein [Bacilli bacterium]
MKIDEIIKTNNQNFKIFTIDKSINSININESGKHLYIYNHNKDEIKEVNVNINKNLDVIIFEYHNTNHKILTNINCNILENSNVTYNSFNTNNELESNKKINFNLSKKSTLKTYILELGNNLISNYNINLNEEESSVNFNLMVYADQKITQNHEVNINHLKPHTYSNMFNHAVINNQSSCIFDVKSFIKKGSIKSVAYQTSKILTLSDTCNTELKPQLLIDEHDVMGSHAASCGRASDEILYYMQSRGLDKLSANKLIAIGNLLKNAPEDLIEILISEIERRLTNE